MTHSIGVVTSEDDTFLVGSQESLPDSNDGRESFGVGTKVLDKDGILGSVGSGIVSSKGSHLPGVAKGSARPPRQATRLTQRRPRAFVAE
jgi:hypothetical protein